MRSAQKSSRTRGRGNRKSNGNNVNRVYDSSGPEGKVRGTPQQIIDKYLSLARDAQTSGDRVMAENFLQHAEHYQRILIQATQGQTDRRDQAGDGDEDGFGSDGGMERMEPQGGRSDQPERGRDRQEARRSEDAPKEAAAEPAPAESSVGGMTTIDTDAPGDGEGSLLVDAEEVAQSQPAPAPAPRRRRRSPKSEPAEATANDAPTES